MVAIVAGAIAVLLGAVCGWIFGHGGYSQNRVFEVRDSARWKNIIYLGSSETIFFFFDFERLGVAEATLPKATIMVCFGVAAVVAYCTTIWLTAESIKKSVRTWNSGRAVQVQLDVNRLVREYHETGKAGYDALFSAETARLQAQFDEQNSDEAKRVARITKAVHASQAIKLCTTAVLHNQSAWDATLAEAIIDAAILLVRSHSSKPDVIRLTGSYMRYVQDKDADADLRSDALFSFDLNGKRRDEAGRYAGYLTLALGAGFHADRRVVLPVDSSEASVLPGAPEAVRSRGVAVMNVNPFDGRLGIPEETRAEIDKFFREIDWQRSVASVLVAGPDGISGVLNIDSSEPDILGEGRGATVALFAALEPVAALLSKWR